MVAKRGDKRIYPGAKVTLLELDLLPLDTFVTIDKGLRIEIPDTVEPHHASSASFFVLHDSHTTKDID